jgi:hypothetical protein
VSRVVTAIVMVPVIETGTVPAMAATATVPGTVVVTVTVTADAIVIAAHMDATGIVTRTADAIVNANRAAARVASMVATAALHSHRVMRLVTRRARDNETNSRANVIRNATPSVRHSVSASANASVNNRQPPMRMPFRL